MAYGITDPSQLLDYQAVMNGCQAYINALNELQKCGDYVCQAGDMCDSKALSIDNGSLEYPIIDLGNSIKAKATELANNAQQVYADAVNIYNAQVDELNEYYRQQAARNNN